MSKYLDIYSVTNFVSQGKKGSRWIRVGVAFPHDDHKGFSIKLDCIPVNGELTIREPKAREDGQVEAPF